MRMRATLTLMLLLEPLSLLARPTNGPPFGVIPHLAAGGPWQTTITVVNTTSSPATVYILFWGDDGSSLNLPVAGLGPVPGVQFNLAANGSGVLQTNASGANTLSGWASFYSDSSGINAIEVFQNQTSGQQLFEASIPLGTLNQFDFILPFDHTGGYYSGVALANPPEPTPPPARPDRLRYS
jgi:hypothetical protein